MIQHLEKEKVQVSSTAILSCYRNFSDKCSFFIDKVGDEKILKAKNEIALIIIFVCVQDRKTLLSFYQRIKQPFIKLTEHQTYYSEFLQCCQLWIFHAQNNRKKLRYLGKFELILATKQEQSWGHYFPGILQTFQKKCIYRICAIISTLCVNPFQSNFIRV